VRIWSIARMARSCNSFLIDTSIIHGTLAVIANEVKQSSKTTMHSRHCERSEAIQWFFIWIATSAAPTRNDGWFWIATSASPLSRFARSCALLQ
jgi:hypothetical protein